MTTYMMKSNIEVEAKQYTKETPQKEVVKLCEMNGGEIYELPRDLMGKPKNAFHAIQVDGEFVRIELNDWIITKNGENMIISNSVFKLLFM